MPSGPAEYAGTLASTGAKSFSSSSCNYTVTLTNIRVIVTVDGDMITNADVKADMVEKVVGSCSRPSIATNTHEHALDKNFDTKMVPNGTPVALAMIRKSGAPPTSLSFTLGQNANGFEASLVWKRTDGDQTSLRWTQTAKVVVQRK